MLITSYLGDFIWLLLMVSVKVVSVIVLVLEELLANHVAERVLRPGVPIMMRARAVVPRLHRHPGHRVGLVGVRALHPGGHSHAGAHHEGEAQEMHIGVRVSWQERELRLVA